MVQTDKPLEAEAVEQLEVQLLVAQVKQLLNQQQPDHPFGGERGRGRHSRGWDAARHDRPMGPRPRSQHVVPVAATCRQAR